MHFQTSDLYLYLSKDSLVKILINPKTKKNDLVNVNFKNFEFTVKHTNRF